MTRPRNGFNFVARLLRDWVSGSNTFSQPDERLVEAFREDRLVGFCGLNRDPYTAQSAAGRLRHLYVSRMARQSGAGSPLVRHLLGEARGVFKIVRLRSDSREAARFYEHLRFRRAEEESATHLWMP
ncbi:MAG: GNAT family N-acetyltransferase [Bradyrhizobium sp.]|uniref:GNAT family N-acetyltransferase n=1 Tax=Bradyrhizobium sp. TaxID=376 RepID=UPI001D45BE64|nr:GNAT family N-acetyltransferase [Bradyrhizobium sp.]MBV9564911.1 GNAT family N-acetyltransferase [Bradyrhizobium sp.]